MSYIIYSLPRSRTAWLSEFLSYGEWHCGHDELRHARTMRDVKAWFSQDCTGTIETAAAPWWRLKDKVAPGVKVAVIRRPVKEVVESLMAIESVRYDRAEVERTMTGLDRKLAQIEARTNCLSVSFDQLKEEEHCARLFEYCLPYRHDPAHWERLEDVNIQIDMRALVRYCTANREALECMVKTATQQCFSLLSRRPVAEPDGMTFQVEGFDDWLRDARELFEEHLVLVGESPDNWQNKNIPLMRVLDEAGCMQVVTARCNGRMFGYLMTLIGPSLVSDGVVTGTNTTFFASPDFPGLGLKLQRAAIEEMKKRGVSEVFMEAGKRGSGPRIETMFKRLGAAEHGHSFRLELEEV